MQSNRHTQLVADLLTLKNLLSTTRTVEEALYAGLRNPSIVDTRQAQLSDSQEMPY